MTTAVDRDFPAKLSARLYFAKKQVPMNQNFLVVCSCFINEFDYFGQMSFEIFCHTVLNGDSFIFEILRKDNI